MKMDKFLMDQHIQLFCENDLKTDIYIKNGNIEFKKYDNRLGYQLFIFDNITIQDIKNCFEIRAIPKNRTNINKILNNLGLKEYDIYDVIKATHGISPSDSFWFKFDDENIKYEDIKIGNV